MRTKIVVLGAGESGVGAALLAKNKGYDVFVSDRNKIKTSYKEELIESNIEFEEGKHTQEKVLLAHEVIKSPGIPDSAPIIQALYKKGVPVIGEIEFAGRYSKAYMIGITGSNGKTTCALWLNYILNLSGKDVALAGNIGVSPCRLLLERDPDIFVLELSSFQLDSLSTFHCNAAVITNITPDHLDRYEHNFEKYILSKLRITRNQTQEDIFIFSADDLALSTHLNRVESTAQQLSFSLKEGVSAAVQNNQLTINVDNSTLKMAVNEVSLSGKHNLYNAMAVGLCALKMGVSPQVLKKGLSTFPGVEHRLEVVAEIDGVLYINDSKATNVNSTYFALESMNRPVIWIAGGTDKGNDYSEIFTLVSKKVKTLICMGIDNSKLLKSFDQKVPSIFNTASIQEAVKIAQQQAKSGDVVLLSPACASFDLFKNFEDRGERFKNEVLQTKVV